MPLPPIANALLLLILGGLFGSFITHYLKRDSDRTDRIRTAKAKIRGWIDLVANASPAYLYKSHETISAEIGSMKNSIVDDLRLWQRGGFERACAEFIKSSDEDCRPVVKPFGETCSKEESDQRHQEWLRPGKVLKYRLEAILKKI